MLTFCGFDIELFIEAVIARQDGPSLCCGRDASGSRWLVVEVDDDPLHLAWLCVPVSERAMHAVVTGRAALRDAIQHSFTGTVELVVVNQGRAVPDRCLLCADVTEDLLPARERLVLAAA
jgi:hypothetical protein